jgi:hypothetical protein
MESKIVLKGHGYFELRKKDGTVIDKWEKDNLVVSSGKERVAKLLNNISSTYFNAIAVGTGITNPVIGDTALEVEVKRLSATLAYEASNKATFEKTFTWTSAEAYNITEAGIFDDESAGGTMLDRFVFSAKAVDWDTDLYVKITITVA